MLPAKALMSSAQVNVKRRARSAGRPTRLTEVLVSANDSCASLALKSRRVAHADPSCSQPCCIEFLIDVTAPRCFL
jgi:hypothetical protein